VPECPARRGDRPENGGMPSLPDDPDADVLALTRVVGGFGLASLLAGGALTLLGRGDAARGFGQQTAAWGAVDVAIAGLSAARTGRSAPDPTRLHRILLVNAALDVGYVAAGAHVAWHGTTFGGRLGPEAARGHGAAVVVQGLGLLAIDLAFASRMRRHSIRAAAGATS
jgi:hypothetical protein